MKKSKMAKKLALDVKAAGPRRPRKKVKKAKASPQVETEVVKDSAVEMIAFDAEAQPKKVDADAEVQVMATEAGTNVQMADTEPVVEIRQKDEAPLKLCFVAMKSEFAEAAIMLRNVIGWIYPLNDSLLGRNPSCAKMLRLNLREHREMRKFTDVAGMIAFQEYLNGVIIHSCRVKPGLQPRLDRHAEQGFEYRCHSKRAMVGLKRDGEAWKVYGECQLGHMFSVESNLPSKGFTIEYVSA